MFKWFKLLSKNRADDTSVANDLSVNQNDIQAAINIRDQMLKPVIFGKIGGTRPEKDNRARSWWGGNFLGEVGETVPTCLQSGREMQPILQIRVDELPVTLASFSDFKLINIWMDLQAKNPWDGTDGTTFCLRTYSNLDRLIPIGPAYRENKNFPTFPVEWCASGLQQPSWEDIAFQIPDSVAQSRESDWFFRSPHAEKIAALQMQYPIKLGGWPTWIQGSQWPEEATFLFQIDSTDKGQLCVGDSGSVYLFSTPRGWEIRSDCF